MNLIHLALLVLLSIRIFVPMVFTPPPPGYMAAAIVNHEAQQRDELLPDYRLTFAAQRKAELLSEAGACAHEFPPGDMPNAQARRAGFPLPRNLASDGNQIESLVCGEARPGTAFALLYGSPSHRSHLLGEGDFYRAQDRIGVGFAESEMWSVYVILIAKEDTGE